MGLAVNPEGSIPRPASSKHTYAPRIEQEFSLGFQAQVQ